jgi:coenzyme PQQ precursor peptide PqqA
MTWETPAFEEINMSAEIGGYQGDSDGGNRPPAAEVTTEADAG